MNRKVIEEIKNEINTWYEGPNGETFFDAFRHYVLDLQDGIASEEERSTFGSSTIVEDFKGWETLLPSTKDVFDYSGNGELRFYEWKENQDYSDLIVWDPRKTDDIPPVARRFIKECQFGIIGVA